MASNVDPVDPYRQGKQQSRIGINRRHSSGKAHSEDRESSGDLGLQSDDTAHL